MRLPVLVLLVVAAAAPLHAQHPWQPSAGHQQVPLWPGVPPDAHAAKGPETTEWSGPNDLVAGRQYLSVERVATPTLTLYAPPADPAHKSRPAVLVFPGGGYEILAIDLEGTEVCDWLLSRGVVCAVVKYRVPALHLDQDRGAYPASPLALEDGQRALRMVRAHAGAWGIDPHRVGVLGFSAGGHLVAAMSVHMHDRVYPPVDAVDGQSARPDFAVALYPGHLSRGEGTLRLNPDIRERIGPDTPPTFLLQDEDDHVDSVWDAASYWAALVRAHVPVEFHSYAQGGHAFGLRPAASAATRWPALVEVWLRSLGVLE